MTIADIGRLQGATTVMVQALVEAAAGDASKVARALGDAMSINVLEALATGAVERGCDRRLAPRHLVQDASSVRHVARCAV